MLPPGLEEETLHHTGTDGLGAGPWTHNPNARASLRIPRLQEQGLAPTETERACTTSNYINQLP